MAVWQVQLSCGTDREMHIIAVERVSGSGYSIDHWELLFPNQFWLCSIGAVYSNMKPLSMNPVEGSVYENYAFQADNTQDADSKVHEHILMLLFQVILISFQCIYNLASYSFVGASNLSNMVFSESVWNRLIGQMDA